jgi:hypothetical protein
MGETSSLILTCMNSILLHVYNIYGHYIYIWIVNIYTYIKPTKIYYKRFSLFMTPLWNILHFKILCNNARSEVLTVLLLKIQGFWQVMLCQWMSSSQCFARLQYLYHYGHAVLWMQKWRHYDSSKCWEVLIQQHNITTPNTRILKLC